MIILTMPSPPSTRTPRAPVRSAFFYIERSHLSPASVAGGIALSPFPRKLSPSNDPPKKTSGGDREVQAAPGSSPFFFFSLSDNSSQSYQLQRNSRSRLWLVSSRTSPRPPTPFSCREVPHLAPVRDRETSPPVPLLSPGVLPEAAFWIRQGVGPYPKSSAAPSHPADRLSLSLVMLFSGFVHLSLLRWLCQVFPDGGRFFSNQ